MGELTLPAVLLERMAPPVLLSSETLLPLRLTNQALPEPSMAIALG